MLAAGEIIPVRIHGLVRFYVPDVVERLRNGSQKWERESGSARDSKVGKDPGGMKTIVAIDPGLWGGVAMSRFGKTECWPMPETQGDLLVLVQEIWSDSATRAATSCVC